MEETKKRSLEEIDRELTELEAEEKRIQKRLKSIHEEASQHPDCIIREFNRCESIPQQLVADLVKGGRLTLFTVTSDGAEWDCSVVLDGTRSVFHTSVDDDDDDERWYTPFNAEQLKKIRTSKRWEWLSKHHGDTQLGWKLAWMYFFDTMYFSDE